MLDHFASLGLALALKSRYWQPPKRAPQGNSLRLTPISTGTLFFKTILTQTLVLLSPLGPDTGNF